MPQEKGSIRAFPPERGLHGEPRPPLRVEADGRRAEIQLRLLHARTAAVAVTQSRCVPTVRPSRCVPTVRPVAHSPDPPQSERSRLEQRCWVRAVPLRHRAKQARAGQCHGCSLLLKATGLLDSGCPISSGLDFLEQAAAIRLAQWKTDGKEVDNSQFGRQPSLLSALNNNTNRNGV